jgi:hypothetical protein
VAGLTVHSDCGPSNICVAPYRLAVVTTVRTDEIMPRSVEAATTIRTAIRRSIKLDDKLGMAAPLGAYFHCVDYCSDKRLCAFMSPQPNYSTEIVATVSGAARNGFQYGENGTEWRNWLPKNAQKVTNMPIFNSLQDVGTGINEGLTCEAHRHNTRVVDEDCVNGGFNMEFVTQPHQFAVDIWVEEVLHFMLTVGIDGINLAALAPPTSIQDALQLLLNVSTPLPNLNATVWKMGCGYTPYKTDDSHTDGAAPDTAEISDDIKRPSSSLLKSDIARASTTTGAAGSMDPRTSLPGGVLMSVFNSSVPGPAQNSSAIWCLPALLWIPPDIRRDRGVLLAVAEGRKDSLSDDAPCTLGLRRSTDVEASWGPVSLPYRG